MQACSSAKLHLDCRALAFRCFLDAFFPCLRLVLSRMSVRFSNPIKEWGYCSTMRLLTTWLASCFNRLSRRLICTSLLVAERVPLCIRRFLSRAEWFALGTRDLPEWNVHSPLVVLVTAR